tara:strand:- start:2692 stop:2898 length:207 start_codon:yes stop_codon:yes gene_type:complete
MLHGNEKPLAGDLVRRSSGELHIGIVIEQIVYGVPTENPKYVFVLWPDQGKSLEKIRDLIIVSEGFKE